LGKVVIEATIPSSVISSFEATRKPFTTQELNNAPVDVWGILRFPEFSDLAVEQLIQVGGRHESGGDCFVHLFGRTDNPN
jgi:hypothetical protein